MDGTKVHGFGCLGAVALMSVVACSGGATGNGGTAEGGESIAGVGIGVISGFGGVTLNDEQRFGIDPRTRLIIDGEEVETMAAFEAKANGMVAFVEVREDVAADFSSGTAARVTAGSSLKGPVTGTAPLQVLGQTLVVTGDTVLADLTDPGTLAIGDLLEVSGFNGEGNFVYATRLERKPAGLSEWKVTGRVTATSGSDFSVGSQVVLPGPGVAPRDCVGGAVRSGDFVEVKAAPVVDFTAGDGTLHATRVECKSLALQPPDERVNGPLRAQMEGFVTAIDGDTLRIGEQAVHLTSETVFRNGGREDLSLGVKLEARGVLDAASGVLTASRISFRETRVRIEGPLSAEEVEGDRLTLLGVTVLRSIITNDEDGIFAGHGLPSQVEVRGFVDRQGTVFATRVRETRDTPRVDELRLRGPVSAIDETSRTITLLGVTVVPGPDTRFEDRHDVVISEAAFFERLLVGTPVQARRGSFGAGPPATITSPREIEIED